MSASSFTPSKCRSACSQARAKAVSYMTCSSRWRRGKQQHAAATFVYGLARRCCFVKQRFAPTAAAAACMRLLRLL